MSFIWMFSNFPKGTWAISVTYRMVLLDLLHPVVPELTLIHPHVYAFNIGFGGTSLLL